MKRAIFVFELIASCLLAGACNRGVATVRDMEAASANKRDVSVQTGQLAAQSGNSPATPAKPHAADPRAALGQDGIRLGHRTCVAHQPVDTSTVGQRQDCVDEEFDFQDARLDKAYLSVMHVYSLQGKSDNAALTALGVALANE